MTANGNKNYSAALGTKNEPSIDTSPAFEIVLAQMANAETRMKVRFAECVAHGVDDPRDIASAGFRKFSNNAPKRF